MKISLTNSYHFEQCDLLIFTIWGSVATLKSTLEGRHYYYSSNNSNILQTLGASYGCCACSFAAFFGFSVTLLYITDLIFLLFKKRALSLAEASVTTSNGTPNAAWTTSTSNKFWSKRLNILKINLYLSISISTCIQMLIFSFHSGVARVLKP